MNTRKVLVYSLIGLASIGLISFLINNPFALLRSVLTLIIFATVIYFILRLFLKGKTDSKEMKKYKQALKQSRKRYEPKRASKGKRKRPSYLRVIDGNKDK